MNIFWIIIISIQIITFFMIRSEPSEYFIRSFCISLISPILWLVGLIIIFCDFVNSARTGFKYKYIDKKEIEGPYEYNDGKIIFVKKTPFSFWSQLNIYYSNMEEKRNTVSMSMFLLKLEKGKLRKISKIRALLRSGKCE